MIPNVGPATSLLGSWLMAAVEHREAIAHKAPSRQRASLLVLLTLAAAYALTVLVFYPGYSTVDARYVYADAMAWHFGDWQSPAMVLLWRLVDPIAPGSPSMFLLTAALYWLAFGLLAFLSPRPSPWVGLPAPLVPPVPPAFCFVGMI